MNAFCLYITGQIDDAAVVAMLGKHGFVSSDETPRAYAYMGGGDAAAAWGAAKAALAGSGVSAVESTSFDGADWVTVAPQEAGVVHA